jgi:hypothetical protein
MKLRKELGEAGKAGKISEEDAKKKFADAEKAVRQKVAAARGKGDDKSAAARKHLLQMRKELGEAVKAGKISEEDAKKKFADAEKAVRERMAAGRGEARSTTNPRENYARVEAELKAKVEAGEITKEGMIARLNALRKTMAKGSEGAARAPGRVDLEGIKRRIEAAVKNGDMTREEADAKYKEIREGMKKRMEGAAKRGDATPEEIGKRLRQAIAEGKISEKDARVRFEAMRKAAAERGGDARSNWEGIKSRIEGAVERGDMTREEAVAKYKEIRERMAEGRER